MLHDVTRCPSGQALLVRCSVSCQTSLIGVIMSENCADVVFAVAIGIAGAAFFFFML